MSTTYVILEENVYGLSYVRLYDRGSSTQDAVSFPDLTDRFSSREAAEANADLLRAKPRRVPAIYTVVECTPENEAAIRQRWTGRPPLEVGRA